MADNVKQLFIDDFSKGQKYPGLPRKITEADVLNFAALTGDRHPIHYDDEYAKTTMFGRPTLTQLQPRQMAPSPARRRMLRRLDCAADVPL
jgi:acyl dehydratase